MMFDNIYCHGFARVAVCIPKVRVADPATNGAETLRLAQAAHDKQSAVALFPELGISAYTNDDLFFQQALLQGSAEQITRIINASLRLAPVLIVGAPFPLQGRLFNCAFVIHRGKLLGIVPKAYLPNYREFYEKRYFAAGWPQDVRTVTFGDAAEVPFGTDLLFSATDAPDL